MRQAIAGFTGVFGISAGAAFCVGVKWGEGEGVPGPSLSSICMEGILLTFFYFAQKTLPVFPQQNEVQIKVLNIGNGNMTIYFPGKEVTLNQMSQVSRREYSFLFYLLTQIITGFGETDL